jgi:competence protein ComEC
MVIAGSKNIHLHALACTAGTLAVHRLPALADCWWALSIIPIAWLFRRRSWSCLLIVFVVAMGWTACRAYLILDQGLPATLESQDVMVTGTVHSLPQPTERYLKFDLDVEHLTHRGRLYPSPGRIRLRDYRTDVEVRAGDRWRFRARLKRPHGFQNPGGFDYEAWLLRHRIRAVGYVRDDVVNQFLGRSWLSLHGFRQTVRDQIRAATIDLPHRGLFVALTVGDRGGIADHDRETFWRTGTSHLIAISGLHVGLVAGLVYWLGAWLWRLCGSAVLYLPASKFGAGAGLLAAVGYAALAGFSIPTQRALIMLMIVLGGIIASRNGNIWRLFSFAVLAVLLWDPLAAMDPSFWLSFGALFVILYLVVGRKSLCSRWRRWMDTQIAVSVGIAPLVIAIFQGVSVVSPIANLLTIPIFTFLVVPATLISSCLLILGEGTLGAFGFAAIDYLLDWFWPILNGIAQIDFAIVWRPAASIFSLACGAIGIAWLLSPRGMPAKWLGGVWVLPMLLVFPPVPKTGELKVTVLDVGQGLSVVVQTATKTMVYDTGARFSDRFDIGKAVLVPFLRDQGIDTVNTLVISHGDNDHIGGLHSLLRQRKVEQRLSSVPDRVPRARGCIPERGWTQDQVQFKILSPLVDRPRAHNDSSCVIHVISRYGSVLLTGDIGAAREHVLLESYGSSLRSDILLVPHQGSKTSSTHAFLDAIRPKVAVVSAGYRNPYGHPDYAVMNRYRRIGVPVYNTAETGAVTIEFGAQGASINLYRSDHDRYWFTNNSPKSVTLFH